MGERPRSIQIGFEVEDAAFIGNIRILRLPLRNQLRD